MLHLILILSLSCYANAWSHNIYGLCNYSNLPVAYYEYDNTLMASAPANLAPYTKGQYGQVDGTYHHIYNCDDEGCMASNNLRVYQETGDIPYQGMLVAFWTDDGYEQQPIRAFGPGVGDTDLPLDSFGWGADCPSCYYRATSRWIDSSLDNFVIVVAINGTISWIAGEGQDVCTALPKPTCTTIQKPEGNWAPISSAPVQQNVTITTGTTHSYTDTTTSEWGNKVSMTVSAGFEVDGFSGGVSVTGETSEQISKEYSSTFSQTTTTSVSYVFPAGVVWQWQFKITDECGTSIAIRQDVQISDSQLETPCCLPGYFADIKKARGDCIADKDGVVTNLCKSSR